MGIQIYQWLQIHKAHNEIQKLWNQISIFNTMVAMKLLDTQKEIDKLNNTKNLMELAAKTVPLVKETIEFDDFAKMDIRIGEIIAAEKMEKSKKLLKLTVNDGIKERTILSGIAEHFKPEEVVGKQVSFLANLAPRKMMGLESEGMILMTTNTDGKLVFVNPDADGVANGETIN